MELFFGASPMAVARLIQEIVVFVFFLREERKNKQQQQQGE